MDSDLTSDWKYMDSFSDKGKALQCALDIRKFEIDMYWKRATYFWVFTGAALAGYLQILVGAKDKIKPDPDALLLTSCIGLVFSVAWYCVNRASKFWQQNWESHVDFLEDSIQGPLYKTVFLGDNSFFRLLGSYPFSVSKINQALSLFVCCIFAMLICITLKENYYLSFGGGTFADGVLSLAVIFILVIFLKCRSELSAAQIDKKAIKRKVTLNSIDASKS